MTDSGQGGPYRQKVFKADTGRSAHKIGAEARQARSILAPEVPLVSAVDCLKTFEGLRKLREAVPGMPGITDYDVKDLPAGIDAATHYDRARMAFVVVLSAGTYEGLERGNSRARFSFAHEVGHLFQHRRELVRLSAIPHRQAELNRGVLKHPIYEDAEWQADTFAGAFLVPDEAIHALVARGGKSRNLALAVSDALKVSLPAARARLRTYHRMYG